MPAIEGTKPVWRVWEDPRRLCKDRLDRAESRTVDPRLASPSGSRESRGQAIVHFVSVAAILGEVSCSAGICKSLPLIGCLLWAIYLPPLPFCHSTSSS